MPPEEHENNYFILNESTGKFEELGEIVDITAETETESEDFLRINKTQEITLQIIKHVNKHRSLQRICWGSNNRRKMHHLPMYRKPARGRRKKR